MTTIKRLKNEIRRLKAEIRDMKSESTYEVRTKLMKRNIEMEHRYLQAQGNLIKMNKLLNKYKLLVGDMDIGDFHKDDVA